MVSSAIYRCYAPQLHHSIPSRLCHLHSASAQASVQPMTMEFSLDELLTAGDWSPPAWYVRIEWGYCWLGTSAREGDCGGPVDGSPPACSVGIVWADCWFCAVFDSLGCEKITRLTEIPVSPSPSFRCLAVPAGSITGPKRRIRETSFCHSVERLFCSLHSEGSSKKLRQLGHQTHHNWHVACRSGSNIRKSRPNSMGKDCDNPKTSASKSGEGNSQYLRFRSKSVMLTRELTVGELTKLSLMRMPSDLDSFLRDRSCNSLASANRRAAFGLLLNCCFRVRKQSVSGEASSVEVIRKKATSTGWDSVPNDLREHIVGLPRARRFWKRQQSVPSETISVGVTSKRPSTTTWDSLPNDLQANVLQRVDFRDLFRFKTLSNSWKKLVEGEDFKQSRGGISEGAFTAINYYIKNKSWRCSGYDLHSKSWRSFPPVSYLPPPDAELFKEYSVCGHGGLMCAEVSKLPKKGEVVVFNPLTGETRALPPLLHPKNPVLVHISVDSAKKSYKVIVAGSSAASDEDLSKKVEVFDSSTSKWKEVCDLPGPAFGLNEHQAGVCLNGKLFFISFLEGGGRGVVAFDVENGKWLQDLTVPFPWSSYSNTLQLIESDGKLFVFSEQELDQSVDHCIDELEFPNPKAGVLTCLWKSFVEVMKSGGRGLQLCILLASISFVTVPSVAYAEDQSIQDSLSRNWIPSIASRSLDMAKAVAGTVLAGVMMIGAAKFAWGSFRGRQAPGNRIDIMQGLEHSGIPTRGNPKWAIPPVIPA